MTMDIIHTSNQNQVADISKVHSTHTLNKVQTVKLGVLVLCESMCLCKHVSEIFCLKMHFLRLIHKLLEIHFYSKPNLVNILGKVKMSQQYFQGSNQDRREADLAGSTKCSS